MAAMEQQMPRLPGGTAQVSGPVWTTEQVRVILGRRGSPISRQAVHDRVQRGTLLVLRVAEHGKGPTRCGSFIGAQMGGR